MAGFTIPAGAQVIPLISSVHMDPELWDQPEEFKPERFIGANGNVQRPEFFMPFGVGRRRCLGDTLARMEMFLFFACLMHGYDISLPEGEPLPSLNGVMGAVISPQAVRMHVKPRPLHLDENNNNNNDNNVAGQKDHLHADHEENYPAAAYLDGGVLRNVGSY